MFRRLVIMIAVAIMGVGSRVVAAGDLLRGVTPTWDGWSSVSNPAAATDGDPTSYLNALLPAGRNDGNLYWSMSRSYVAELRIRLKWTAGTSVVGPMSLELQNNGTRVWFSYLALGDNTYVFYPNVTANRVRLFLNDNSSYAQNVEVYWLEAYSEVRDTTPPSAPSGVQAVAGDTTVTISWSAVPDTDLAKYRVYRDGSLIAEVTGTTYMDANLTNGVTYTYEVSAVDKAGNESPKSAAVTATPMGPPRSPVLQITSLSQTTVDIAWEPIGNADGFRMYRNSLLIAQLPSGSQAFHDSGLSPETEYTYKLVVYNKVGESQATVTVTTLPPPPPPPDPPGTPVGLGILDVSKTTASLGWSVPLGLVRGYRVYRNGLLVAETRDTVFVDRNLLPQTRYYYQVVAWNEGGESTPAAVAVTTLAASFSETVRAGLESSLGRARDYVVSAAGGVAPWIVVIAALVTAVKLGNFFLGLWR